MRLPLSLAGAVRVGSCRCGGAAVGIFHQRRFRVNYPLRHADDVQRERWLAGFATGETIGTIAMTEPHAGSDLRAIGTTTAAARRWVGDQRT